MESPFPGMDPYLEDPAFWRDFHATYIGCWREAVADALPDNYDALLDETVNLVQMSPEVIKLIYPDVAVSREPRRTKGVHAKHSGTLLLEPTEIPHEFLEEVRQKDHRQDERRHDREALHRVALGHGAVEEGVGAVGEDQVGREGAEERCAQRQRYENWISKEGKQERNNADDRHEENWIVRAGRAISGCAATRRTTTSSRSRPATAWPRRSS